MYIPCIFNNHFPAYCASCSFWKVCCFFKIPLMVHYFHDKYLFINMLIPLKIISNLFWNNDEGLLTHNGISKSKWAPKRRKTNILRRREGVIVPFIYSQFNHISLLTVIRSFAFHLSTISLAADVVLTNVSRIVFNRKIFVVSIEKKKVMIWKLFILQVFVNDSKLKIPHQSYHYLGSWKWSNLSSWPFICQN